MSRPQDLDLQNLSLEAFDSLSLSDLDALLGLDNLPSGMLREAAKYDPLIYVPTGETALTDFTNCAPSIGTSNMNGCTVVAIWSEGGAILAHIPPALSYDSTSAENEDNVRDMMNEVSLLRDARADLFPADKTAATIICARYRGERALPDQVAIVEGIKQMGYRRGVGRGVQVSEYDVSELRDGERNASVLLVRRDASVEMLAEHFEIPEVHPLVQLALDTVRSMFS